MQEFEIDDPNKESLLDHNEEGVFHRGRESRVSIMRPDHGDWGGKSSETSHQDDGHQRDRFNSYFEYMLSVLGFAAGFGSLWRFPYLVFKNGGGAFLIPYFILMFCIGIPAYYFETVFGQMYQKGPPKIYETVGKRFKGFGFLSTFIAFNEASYYNLILAYSLYYMWQSLKFPLPWKVDWDTNPEPWNKEYFYNDVLKSTDSINELGTIVWPIFYCYAISQIVVYFCVQKGVAVSGKIALFTATSPYVLLVILMLRGFTLDGAYDGLSYFLTPNLSKLLEIEVWTDAASQVIFQFSIGISVLVFFGSYRDKKSEVHKSAVLIPCLTCLCGFLSGFCVFSYMGYMAKVSGIPIQDLPLQGPDLTFIAYPAVLTMLPFENLWAVVFFAVMIFLGIDTQFGFMDGIAGTIEDEFGTSKGIKIFGRYYSMRVVRFLICLTVIFTGFLYSTQSGFYYLGFVDSYTTAVPSLFSVGFETFFFTHFEDWKTIELKIIRHIKIPTPKIYIFFLKWVVPTLCFGLGFGALLKQISKIADQNILVTLFGWTITLYPFVIAFYTYQKYKGEDFKKKEEEERLMYKKQAQVEQYEGM